MSSFEMPSWKSTVLSAVVMVAIVGAEVDGYSFTVRQSCLAPRTVSPRNIAVAKNSGRRSSSVLCMFRNEAGTDRVVGKNADFASLGTLSVPSVGVGTISWSSDSLTTLENLELQNLVSTAVSCNAGFFDTAERYGNNLKTAFGLGWGETERLTRKLLDRAIDQEPTPLRPIVATKFTPTPWRTTAQSVVEACEQSCKRLGVSQLDLYQIHMPDIVQPLRLLGFETESKDEVYWEGVAECYRRGLVANVGVSNYGPTMVEKCQEYLAQRDVPLASNQIAYSLLGRHNGAQETVDACQDLGVRVLAYYPFAMGLLTGKYTSAASNTNMEGPSSSSAAHLSIMSNTLSSLTKNRKTSLEIRDLQRYARGGDKNIPRGGIAPLLKVLDEIAQGHEKTVAQVALNYIICKGAIPIPGARTVAQVQDNMGAMGWRLSPEEVQRLEQTADSLGFGFDGAGFKRTSEKFVGYGVEKWVLD